MTAVSHSIVVYAGFHLVTGRCNDPQFQVRLPVAL
jgi:hypothetical protein